MFYVTKTYDHSLGLAATFRQPGADSHCRWIHGYPLSFKFKFGAQALDRNNWVFDFGGLKEVKAHLVTDYDHRLMIAKDDPQRERLLDLGRTLRLGGCISPDCEAEPLANPRLVDMVGCEGFAKAEFDWVDEWIHVNYDTDIVTRQLRLVSVEVREHGGNSAIYEG